MTAPDQPSTMKLVTDLAHADAATGAAADADADAAVLSADAAARAAGVGVRALVELDEFAGVERLYDEIWRPDASPPISTELLRALSKAGNYVAGAFDGDKLVGACVGFFAAPPDYALHSHIAGVSSTVVGRHVGYALKLHQRAWALLSGLRTIEWTFDPLVARNAYFNLVKLGARPAEYLPNFYGGMRDGINGDDDSDRLLVHWELLDPQVVDACSGHWSPADITAMDPDRVAVALARGDDGAPVLGSTHAPTLLVAVPRNIETLRLTDPDPAKKWRIAVRETLGGLLADGSRITGFDRAGWYIVERLNDKES